MQVKQQKRISWLWLFVPQLLMLWFVAFLFDKISLQVFQWIFVSALVVFPVLGYVLLLLLRPDIRRAWGDAIFDTWTGTGKLLRVVTFRNFLKFMAELETDESVPKTKEQWISIALLPRRVVGKIIETIRRLDWFPKSKNDWFAFTLLPAKTHVIAGLPMLWMLEWYVKWFNVMIPRRGLSDAAGIVAGLYFLSLLMLLFGALFQSIFCRRGQATTSIWFLLLGLIFLWIIHPFRLLHG